MSDISKGGILITVSENELRRALQEKQALLEQTPRSWVYLEAIGRCLKGLSDPGYTEFFRRAADLYPFTDTGSALLNKGHLYLLSGDSGEASAHFQKARLLLEPELEKKMTSVITSMIECQYLLQNYEAVLSLTDILGEKFKRNKVRAHAVIHLAKAQKSYDRTEVTAAIELLEQFIRKERAKYWSTGGLTLWDWYEKAQTAGSPG